MLRAPILFAARSPAVERLVTQLPVSRRVVQRFVGGADTASALDTAQALADAGLTTSLDYLGEDTHDAAQAEATVQAYLALLTGLQRAGLTGWRDERRLTARTEVSVKLSAIGQAIGPDGPKIALDGATRISAAAAEVGATVTLDAEDHTTTDSTLGVLAQLREDFPNTGAVLQAYLRRTEGDCRDLAQAGSRVRLCKGAYAEPASVAFTERLDVDRSYVRCLNVLLAGPGYPMLATHDPELISIGQERAKFHGRRLDEFEFQLLYGIRPDEQRQLLALGHTVRVYIPYGQRWYGYLMRRLAERPANLGFFLRALVSTK